MLSGMLLHVVTTAFGVDDAAHGLADTKPIRGIIDDVQHIAGALVLFNSLTCDQDRSRRVRAIPCRKFWPPLVG